VFVRWWQCRVNVAGRKEHALVQRRPTAVTRRHGLKSVAVAAALAIHAATAGLVVATVFAALSDLPLVLKVVIGAVCLGIALVVAPRPWQQRRAAGWTRSDAPQLFALLDAVASGVGGKTPDRVVVSDVFATALNRRHTLTIGLPLWRALSDGERLAMLAHHLSDPAALDVRRLRLVSAAAQTLQEWLDLSRPSDLEHRVSARRRRRLPLRFSNEFRLSDVLIPFGLSPFYLVVLSIGAVMRLTSLRCGHRAVYAADAVAASAAGSAATRGWLDVVLMGEALEASMSLALRKDAGSDLLAVAKGYPARLPERERARLRRRDTLRAADALGDDPPVGWRWELVPASSAQTSISDVLVAGADVELTRAEPDVRRELRSKLADSTL
jgi:hypothetical protein